MIPFAELRGAVRGLRHDHALAALLWRARKRMFLLSSDRWSNLSLP